MYLNSRTPEESDTEEEEEEEEEDTGEEERQDREESEVLDDESHYITTHEIQLTELDHDVDSCDHPDGDGGGGVGGRPGSGGDGEDDNLVYTFVDYARLLQYPGGRGDDDDDGGGGGSSDDSAGKAAIRLGPNQERLIHVSIEAAPSDGSDAFSPATDVGGGGRVGRAPAASAAAAGGYHHRGRGGCDFIPPPGRQHLATKLRWKDVNSSGASSSISELDDADKEVRNLTAKTFRSLACPYFDAIHLGATSSESSSVSEYGLGLNKWSAYVNLKHGGHASRQRGRGLFTRNGSSATVALKKAGGGRHVAPAKQPAAAAAASSPSNATLTPELPQWGDVITLTETINVHVEAELPEGGRHSRCHKHCTKEGGGVNGSTQKRATIASSHLKSVISKKMQFEHERKLERGDRAARSPCPQCGEQELGQARGGPHRRSSEAGSELTVNSLDEIAYEGLRPHSRETKEEKKDSGDSPERGAAEKVDSTEPPKAQLNRSHCSAFTLLKAEPPGVHAAAAAATSAQGGTGGSGVVNKLSHLFVPDLSALHGGKEPPGTDRKDDNEKVAKPPEIKIRLRSAKENHGHMLNIANLLTPKISNTVKTLRTTGYSRLQVLSAPDRVPHFTVRDMRENKCKFQMPIYHVRDVRKLVKSSYNFVATDNGDNKCPTSAAVAVPVPGAAATTTSEVYEDMRKKDSVKHVSPSPIFIKCNSVKTNGSCQQPPETSESSQQQKPAEASRFSPKVGECLSSHWSAAKATPAVVKQPNPEQQRAERPAGDPSERKNDPKVPNQAALEKLQAAVKTMEQLYVFDRNEWKRRSHAVPQQQPVNHVATQQQPVSHVVPQQQTVSHALPQQQTVSHAAPQQHPVSHAPPQQQPVSHAGPQQQPVSHSHVLSLIASEERVARGGLRAGRSGDATAGSRTTAQTFTTHASTSGTAPDKDSKGVIHVPVNREPIRAQPQLSKTFCEKSVLHLDKSKKIPVSIRPQNQALSQASCTLKRAKTPGAPQLFKIEVPKDGRQVDQGKAPTANSSPTTAATATPSNVGDPGNYLTIPRQGYTSEIQLLHPPNTKGDPATTTKPKTGTSQRPECAQTHPVVLQNHPANMDCPSATIYHHPRHHHQPSSASPPQGAPPQPGLFRFSPSTSSPSPSPGSEPPLTQRKMLLDITTGYYYLVDTPLQPAIKRLFDPETGRYVDVPVSHSPVTPIPLSPLTLSPGAYGATPAAYMIYPGLMVPPSPTLAPQADALLPAAGTTSGLPIPPSSSASPAKYSQQQEVAVAGAESPYYSATREAAHVPSLQLPAAAGLGGHVAGRCGGGGGGRKPVISITTQQGPRIIAPPSFDGTTMSFVVEHR
ncbi:hypothetical protein CRUP_005913 [Coryphaenoides rupestris]|nr:hypothetical protein CRUP_005913 [Coryphaenoides rupestris]